MLAATVDHPPSTPDSPASQRPLDSFRQRQPRLKIHPMERGLMVLVSVHLVFLPWAFGANRLWAQWISLALACVAIVVALVPRAYTEEHTGGNRFRLVMWPKLVRFPLFWTGLLLLGYILLQALNPAWSLRTDGKLIWLEKIPSIAWLPTGFEGPIDKWNPWRMMIIYGSAWLTACAIWIGFTRRRTVQILLSVLAANGLLLAAFGVQQRLMGNGKMFWFVDSPSPSFFASFVYKNHAAIYLNLVLAVTCGLAGWYYLRGLRRLEKSNPSGVLAFFATCIGIAILTSYARGATLMMLTYLALCIGVFFWHQIIAPGEHRKPVVAVVLVLIFGFFLKTGLDAVNTGEAWERLRIGLAREDRSLEFREKIRATSVVMLRDNYLLGTGAGSYRYLFPNYLHRDPELVRVGATKLYWEHAHCDIIQFPIELGLFGTALILAGAGYLGVALLRAYFWENPLSSCLVLGVLLTVVYAWWDFPFQCTAILVTACALLTTALLWARFEEQGTKS